MDTLRSVSAGTYKLTVTDANGCIDSTSLTLTAPAANLSIDSAITMNNTCAGSCDGSIDLFVSGGISPYTFMWNDTTLSGSNLMNLCAGSYTVTVMDSLGCSTTGNYTIAEPAVIITSAGDSSDCDSVLWAQTGMTYFSSGIYDDTLQAVNGCDSIIRLIVTIKTSVIVDSVQVCNDTSYVWNMAGGDSTITMGGIYYDSLTTVTGGCDSVRILVINFGDDSDTTIMMDTACTSYTWMQNGMTFSQSGMYYDTLMNASGCDSILALDLIIGQTVDTLVQAACDAFTWNVNNQTYTMSGTYSDTSVNSTGCNSISVLVLTINNSYDTTYTASSCVEYTWSLDMDSIRTFNQSGLYSLNYISSAGCDSIVRLNLSILDTTFTIDTVAACESYTWGENNKTYTDTDEQFMKMDSVIYTNAAGCDSTVYLYLQIIKLNRAIINLGDSALAVEKGPRVTYQWINCNENNSPVAGATMRGFVPSDTGKFASIITDRAVVNNVSCTDTTNCVFIQYIGLTKIADEADFSIYPNPTMGQFTFKAGSRPFFNQPLQLFDLNGRLINEYLINREEQFIDLKEVEKGIYFIRFNDELMKLIVH